MTPHTITPTVVRCTTTAQFLASIPVLLGYIPKNSIVVTLFEGSRAQSAARFDLPPFHAPLESTLIDESVLRLVAQVPGAGSVAIVVYTDETFARSSGTPHALLAMWLERAVELNGIPVRELVCIAADAWAPYRSSGHDVPRSLDEISTLQEEFITKYSRATSLDTLESLGTLPDPDRDLRARIDEALDADHLPDIDHLTRPEFVRLVAQCSSLLTHGVSHDTIEAAATLIGLTQYMQTWLIPVMLIAADTEEELASLSNDTAEAFLALLQNPALTPAHGGPPVTQRLLMFSSERLEQGRLRTIVNTLVTLAAHTRDDLRAGVLALAAWAWWMGAMPTPASMLLREAKCSNDTHAAVRAVQYLIDSGTPLWVFARETSA